MTPRRAAATVLAGALLLSACSGGKDPEPVPGLDRLVDSTLGDGAPVVRGATGPMQLDLAAASTAVPSRQLAPFLRTHGFQGGYARTWQSGEVVTTALAFHFFAERDVSAFVDFSVARLATSQSYLPYDDATVPGSAGFQLVATVRGATRFCVGEYVPVARDAFLVTRCATYPLSTPVAQDLARRQRDRALKGTP